MRVMNIFLLGKEYCFVGFNAKKEKENWEKLVFLTNA